MRRKAMEVVFLGLFILSLMTACGSEKCNISDVNSENESSSLIVLEPAPALKPIPKFKNTNQMDYRERKSFCLKDYHSSISLNIQWKIKLGGVATKQQVDYITSYPAVLQYLDTENTLTISKENECEERDDFLAGTEDTYIEAYGSTFDSIEIIEFEQLLINECDSFKVKADVVIDGKSFDMTHVITNDFDGKSFSWMLLDCDGTFSEFDLAEEICYRTNELSIKRIGKGRISKRF